MQRSVLQTVPASVAEALAASNVGTWRTGRTLQHYIIDETAAALCGLDPRHAAGEIPFLRFPRAVHPGDRRLLLDTINGASESGGPLVIEYRRMSPDGSLRWLLARGQFACDPTTGEMQGKGILIDITDSKRDRSVGERARPVRPRRVEDPLDRAADLALRTRHAIDEIGGYEGQALRNAVDALLWALGRTLARRAQRRAFDA